MILRFWLVKCRPCLCLFIAVLCVVTTWDIFAQPAREKVIVGWVDAPPFYQQQASDQPTGFAVQVLSKIADQANFDIEFRQYSSISETTAAQRTGEIHIPPIVRPLSVPGLDMVYSSPIGQAEIVVVQRADASLDTDLDEITNRRVGYFSREQSPEEQRLLGRNDPIELPISGDAIIKLLAGEIDALIAADAWIAAQLRAARLDYRVRRIAHSIDRSDMVVTLHPSRAHLLGAINAAIAKLNTSGELDALRTIWAMNLPVPAPEVLTVGVLHFPPYQVINEDGSFTGFAVESLRDLATRANLNLTFKALTMDEWQAGPGPERYDLLPQIGISDDRLLRMDFTQPIDESSYSMFVRAGDDQGFTDLDDLKNQRVGVAAANYARKLAEQHGELTLEILDKGEDLVSALMDQRVDVALFTTESMREIIAEAGLENDIVAIQPPFFINERAPALRFGLGGVREQLDAVIPGYLVSDSYRQLQQTWFGEEVFWTRKRLMLLIIGGGLIAMIMAAALVWQRWVQKTRDAQHQREEQQKLKLYEQEQAHRRKLQSVVSELERSNRELDNFAYIASHDLKEPLRGIAINANMLMREEVSVAGNQRVNRMIELTTRMEQLISDLLFFSRLGRGDQSQEDIDTGTIIKFIEYELLETLELTSGTILIETTMPRVHADKTKIKVVFQNLIANALKYNHSKKKLVNIGFQESVKVKGRQLQNVFYVKDNGIGIDEKNHEKIFRIFTRLNRAKDYGQGTGAGLSFVSKIIEEYGNKITIASSLEQGTTFYFPLPLSENSQSENSISNQLKAA